MALSQSLSPDPSNADERGEARVELHYGAAAEAWLQNPNNISAWSRLCEQCPWSVAFLGPDFYSVWLRNYPKTRQPLILTMTDGGGLRAVMALGVRDGLVTGAGAHQADYHGWVSDGADCAEFIEQSFAKIAGLFPRHDVRLRYLPPATPGEAIEQLRRLPKATIRKSHRHTIKLDRAELEGSLKKKGNKSKINRIKRAGKLEYRNLDFDAFAACLDGVADMYDFRQGALINSCPFHDDPTKRAFHLDWFKALPKQIVANGMFLNDKLISILVYVMSATEAHLAIAAHAPEHGDNSPNKIQMYETGLALIDGGIKCIDLTPGGEEWKARFSDTPETVYELTIHASPAAAALRRASQYADELVHRVAADFNVSLSDIKALSARGAAMPAKLLRRLRGDAARPERYAFAGEPPADDNTGVQINPLGTLLLHGPRLTGLERQPFLSRAWFRIEAGWRCFVLASESGVEAMGWVSSASKAAAVATLCDFAAVDRTRYPALIAQMLRDARARDAACAIEAEIAANDGDLRSAIEALGGKRIA